LVCFLFSKKIAGLLLRVDDLAFGGGGKFAIETSCVFLPPFLKAHSPPLPLFIPFPPSMNDYQSGGPAKTAFFCSSSAQLSQFIESENSSHFLAS
jgi:hypothetical protein